MKVTLQNTATYGDEGVGFDFEKRINLIYGLNGVGKTILSNFIYKKANASQEDNKEEDDKYKDCKLEGVNANDIAVYNQEFVRENFYLYKKEEAEEQKEELPGIFSLSKKNKYIGSAIEKLEKELRKLQGELGVEIKKKKEEEDKIALRQKEILDNIWKKIKIYNSLNHPLTFCFDSLGLGGSKQKLYDYIIGLTRDKSPSTKTTDELNKEAGKVLGVDVQPYDKLSFFDPEKNLLKIEKNDIFQEIIVGNEDNPLSKIIEEWNNSDWVREGHKYLPDNIPGSCPFCQKGTIDQKFVDDITKYFSQDYQNKVNEIENIKTKYEEHSDNEFKKFTDENIRVIGALDLSGKEKLSGLLAKLENKLDKNKANIKSKTQHPNNKIKLEDTSKEIKEVNDLVKKMNSQIQEYNKKIADIDETKKQIKKEFWDIMRIENDLEISNSLKLKKNLDGFNQQIDDEIKQREGSIADTNKKIQNKRESALNTDVALESINKGLHELGIDNFTIGKANEKDQDNKYKLVRKGQNPCTFVSLSEGEKTIISFLYFRALCHGTLEPEGKAPQIIVIDDPVSSLSINFVFHLSDWIKKHFCEEKYSKIIILTHSLYFFRELDKILKGKIKRFRLTKSEEYSKVCGMNEGEIKNEYESYWQILKDFKAGQTPRVYEVVMANTARNILEYFFTFMGKKPYLNEKIKKLNAEPFWRLVSRESHSDENNLLDYKDFITDNFFKDFEEIFESAGHEDHYKKMMEGNGGQRGMNKHQSKPRKN